MNLKEDLFILSQKDDGSREITKALLSFIREKWGKDEVDKAINMVKFLCKKSEGEEGK